MCVLKPTKQKKDKHDTFSSLAAGQEVYDICDEGVWNNFITLLSIYLDDVSVLYILCANSPTVKESNVEQLDCLLCRSVISKEKEIF